MPLFAAAAEPPSPLLWAGLLLMMLALLGGLLFYRHLFASLYLRGSGLVRSERLGPPEFGVAVAFCAFIAMLAAGSTYAGSGAEQRTTSLSMDQLLTGSLLQFALCVVILAVLLVRKHNLAELFGLDRPHFARQLAWAVLFLVALYPIIDATFRLVLLANGNRPPPQPIVEYAQGLENLREQILMILFAVMLAPITEELLFRGFLYPAFKRQLGGITALVLSSVLFGFIHLHGPSFLPLTLFGVALAMSYEKTGSLLVPILMHSIFNAFNLAAMRLLPDLL